MIVAVIAVRMMQVAVYEVIGMIAMRDGLVPAVWTVLVSAAVVGGAAHGICGTHRYDMLIDVILMHVMKMTIVKIVDMAVMPDCRVPAPTGRSTLSGSFPGSRTSRLISARTS